MLPNMDIDTMIDITDDSCRCSLYKLCVNYDLHLNTVHAFRTILSYRFGDLLIS